MTSLFTMHLSRCLLIFSTGFLSTIAISSASSECDRHRKPWHLSTYDEQMLYVRAYQQLRNNGQLDTFIEAHHLADTPIAFADVHFTAQFFPWHSYFLTEIESQIRNLGGEFKCFALPYWDFTVDSGYSKANEMPIYNTVLGHDGNINDYCVEDENWNRNVYPTTYLCSETEKKLDINCCLKRHHGIQGHIPDAATVIPHLYYRKWRNFQDSMVKEHTYVHGYISGNDNKTHMFGHNAAEDPLFIMLHNFLMYIRALRMTCMGYDKVINELENYQPYAYDPYQAARMADIKPYLDMPMDFNVLSKMEWSRAHKEDITTRKIFDLKEFDISYELGSFWHDNYDLRQWCGDNINETWFFDTVKYDSDVAVFGASGFVSVLKHNYVMYGIVFVVVLIFMGIGCFRNRLWNDKRVLLELKNKCDEEYGTF
eukprot:210921_1